MFCVRDDTNLGRRSHAIYVFIIIIIRDSNYIFISRTIKTDIVRRGYNKNENNTAAAVSTRVYYYPRRRRRRRRLFIVIRKLCK